MTIHFDTQAAAEEYLRKQGFRPLPSGRWTRRTGIVASTHPHAGKVAVMISSR